MGMIWKGTHVLIKGPTAENAYQSKNQALGSKEPSAELRNRLVFETTRILLRAVLLAKLSN